MKIAIIEDHAMFRDALRKACTDDLKHQVVGETDSGTAAVELILRTKPDVVLLDLGLPDMDGFRVAERVLRALPTVRILAISSYNDEMTSLRIEKSGVHGFVHKSTGTIRMLKDALDEIAAGKTYYCPAFLAARQVRQKNPRSVEKILSEAEQQVLSLIALGLSDNEIGGRLKISPRTAQKHRSNILLKLEIKGTPKLITFAVEHGFGPMSHRG